jgi:hypothetical protein
MTYIHIPTEKELDSLPLSLAAHKANEEHFDILYKRIHQSAQDLVLKYATLRSDYKVHL